MSCVIKFQYKDGVKLSKTNQVVWCGKQIENFDYLFLDAQHAALSDSHVCNSCKVNIVKSLRGDKP